MDKNDLNEWITWFSNVIRELNEEERSILIAQLKEGDESAMCSSFERLLNKEKAEGRNLGLEEGEKLGRVAGMAEAVVELLEEIGEPSEVLKNYIVEQKDLGILKVWHKAAARADSIEEFERAAGIELV